MKRDLKTIIQSKESNISVDHHFFPALALEIGLREGIKLDRKYMEDIRNTLIRNAKEGYLKWDENYPFDYDNTIVMRNVLDSLDIKQQTKLALSWSKKGGIYTYIGGKQAKSNNNVDLLINLRILDYLKRTQPESQDYKRLQEFLFKEREKFKKPVEAISKYYLSEGFLLYCLNPVAKDIGLDIKNLIKLKRKRIRHPTDANLIRLIINKGEITTPKSPIKLFQHPRLELKFSCSYFDKIIEECNLFDRSK